MTTIVGISGSLRAGSLNSALLLVTPEYNNGIPCVFKNAIDWLSRPWFGGRLMASRAHTLFNAAGELTDETLRKQLREYLQGFAAFVAASAASR